MSRASQVVLATCPQQEVGFASSWKTAGWEHECITKQVVAHLLQRFLLYSRTVIWLTICPKTREAGHAPGLAITSPKLLSHRLSPLLSSSIKLSENNCCFKLARWLAECWQSSGKPLTTAKPCADGLSQHRKPWCDCLRSKCCFALSKLSS